LKTEYGCDGYITGRGSNTLGHAKTRANALRAILSAAVTPCGGTDCDDPCRSSWYFYLERFTALDSPADGRENASPSFEKE